jgi:hypothetical protein
VCNEFLYKFVCNISLSKENWVRNWDRQTWWSVPKNEISWAHILMKCSALVYVSNTKQTVWDLWWTNWRWDWVFSLEFEAALLIIISPMLYVHLYSSSHLPPMICLCSANTDGFAKCDTNYILMIDRISINHRLFLCGTSRFLYPLSRVHPRTGHEGPDGQ